MSKVILSIGYESFLLPDDKGLATVLKCLTRAARVSHYHPIDKEVLITKGNVDVSMSYLPKGKKIKAHPDFDEDGNYIPEDERGNEQTKKAKSYQQKLGQVFLLEEGGDL